MLPPAQTRGCRCHKKVAMPHRFALAGELLCIFQGSFYQTVQEPVWMHHKWNMSQRISFFFSSFLYCYTCFITELLYSWLEFVAIHTQ